MEHSTDFKVLLAGRVLGGVSTNLLFSAFESWMNSEHKKRGFPSSWQAEVYAASSVANGCTAVAAGVLAQKLEDYMGHIGPFKGAVALTVVALGLVMRWPENYGSGGEGGDDSVLEQLKQGWR